MKKLNIIILILILAGCLSNAPPSVVGLYGPTPVKQDISGSNAQALVFRVVEFTGEEVFEATKSAMLRLGYNAEVKNEKAGMIAANGYYECGGLRPPVTMAVYIKQINKKPESKFTVILDRHNWSCHSGGEELGANNLVREIQMILSTY